MLCTRNGTLALHEQHGSKHVSPGRTGNCAAIVKASLLLSNLMVWWQQQNRFQPSSADLLVALALSTIQILVTSAL